MTLNIQPTQQELLLRREKVQQELKNTAINACLISSPVNIYYLTGQVFKGYIFLPAEGNPVLFYQRPKLTDPDAVSLRKPEDMPDLLKERNIKLSEYPRIALETDDLRYNEAVRLQKALGLEQTDNASTLMRKVRMIKTDWEVEMIRLTAAQHVRVYEQIPTLYKEGMRDIDLQIEIEKLMRQSGSIGIFRAFGSFMDIFMGTVLVGDNANAPSPYDFSLGGAGINHSFPIGACGEKITAGKTIMVDMSGNYSAYITDITRTFALGNLSDLALKAHKTAIEMHEYLRTTVKPGVSFADIHNKTLEIADKAGLNDYFMGNKQQAKFTGHGFGIEINEMPVFMARSKDLFQENMTVAFEPKFVIPEIGGVGIENSYLITSNGIENLTPMEEDIIFLD